MTKYGRRNRMPASLRSKRRPKTVKESATTAPQQVKGSHLEVVCMIGLLAKCNPSFENSTQDKETGISFWVIRGVRRALLTPQGWVGLQGESKAELDDEEERHQEDEEEQEEEQEAKQDEEEMSVSSSQRRRVQPTLGAAVVKKLEPLKTREPKLVFKAGWGL
jgi:hypothetical protein